MAMVRQLYHFIMRYQGAMYGLSLLLALIISVLSLTPLDELPEVPGGDKLHHFIAYGALAFPTAFIRSRYLVGLTLLYLILGGGIELIQPYVNRYGEWRDFAANAGGTALGTAGGLVLSSFSRTHSGTKK